MTDRREPLDGMAAAWLQVLRARRPEREWVISISGDRVEAARNFTAIDGGQNVSAATNDNSTISNGDFATPANRLDRDDFNEAA